MSLEPIDAESALELYLVDKENELSDASLTGHKYWLGHFVRWCDEVEGIAISVIGETPLFLIVVPFAVAIPVWQYVAL